MERDQRQQPDPISHDLLTALNTANVAASIVELADVVSATADRYGLTAVRLMAEQIKANGRAICAAIVREVDGNRPVTVDGVLVRGVPGAACGPQCAACRMRLGGVHLGPEATS